ERFRAAGYEAHVGRPVELDQAGVGLRRYETHTVVETEVVDQTAEPRQLGLALGPTGPADDHEHGAPVVEERQRLHRDVDAFERLDAADEQQGRAIAEPERGARRCAVAG